MKRFLLYLLRWQLSTPILALCLSLLNLGIIWNTIIANLVGGCIFFWVDRWIFKDKVYKTIRRDDRDGFSNKWSSMGNNRRGK